jgi:murein DD-endopeptidase MepM/ murein hydrolase activator NlpD
MNMVMKASDPIIGAARGDAATAIAYYIKSGALRPEFLAEYVNAVFDIAPQAGIDPANVVAQGDLEASRVNANGSTTPFASEWWVERGNPAGLGITGDDEQNAQSRVFKTGEEAARAHIAHLLLYATGRIDKAGLKPADDPRYDAYVRAFGNTAQARTLAELEGKWAVGPNAKGYGSKIAERGNRAFPNLPNASAATGTTPPPIVVTPLPPASDWRAVLDRIFGKGWRLTQDWAAYGGPDLYSYGKEHGLDGAQHTGLDIGVAYGTRMYAPFGGGIVVCSGSSGSGVDGVWGCGAFNDWGDGGAEGSKKGIGRIELYWPNAGVSLIFGHSRTMTVELGDEVNVNELIGTSGGMYGAHIHLEARRFVNGKMTLIDPRDAFRLIADSLVVSIPEGEDPIEEPPAPQPQGTPETLDWSELSFPMGVSLIPKSQTNQRPGRKQTVEFINFHETGNTRAGTGAEMHRQWLHNGAPGAASPEVSVHFFVDDKRGYQMLPLNEISWNAGCGATCAGNIAALSIELCVNSDGDYNKARRNVEELIGFLIAKLGLTMDAVKFHQDWSGKWCPALALSRGLKPAILKSIEAFWTAFRKGAPAPTSPLYAERSPVLNADGSEWTGDKDLEANGVVFHADVQRVRTASESLNVRVFAALDAELTRSPLKVGEEFDVVGWVNGEEVGGERRWWITKHHSRVWVGGTEQKPSENKPEDPADNVPLPGVPDGPKIVNGVRFYPLGADGKGREITVSRDAEVRQWASDDSDVQYEVSEGDKLFATHWIHGKEVDGEDVYWVLNDEYRLHILDTVEHPF